VLKGALEDVRKSFGENTLRIDFEGDGEFLAQLPEVRKGNVVTNSAELTLADGADPQRVLQSAMGRVRIRRFEVGAPSLEKIFIDQVGAETLGAEAAR